MTAPIPFGAWELLGEISHGGMAEVQFALRRGTRGPVYALKTILKQYQRDPNFQRFFVAEIELTRALRHPNIVEVIDSGQLEDTPFLVMEYIHGRALSRLLHSLGREGKRLPLPHAAFIAIKALRALEHAHQATDAAGRPLHVVMCDISPSNIMVSYRGEVKLIDFGIATSRMRFFEQIGMLKGKKNYMAPEQLRGSPLDHRADIFAMGIVLHELVTGQTVFGGRSEFEVEQLLRSGNLPWLRDSLANVPPMFDAVAARALASNPDDRYASAGEFADALEPFARLGKGRPIEAEDLGRVMGLYVAQLAQEDDARLAQVLARDATPVSLPPEGPETPTPPTGDLSSGARVDQHGRAK